MSRTVRTTMQPDREIEVDDADYLDLQRQGLLLADASKTVTTLAVPEPTTTKKTSGVAGSKES
jgi:hypothetical protein